MSAAMIRQVATVKLGCYSMELDEKKMEQLAESSSLARQNIEDLTELSDRLLKLTDHFAGLEAEIVPFLRMICDIKDDYRVLLSLGIEKEGGVDNE
ncbi:MAG: hypothetical protein ACTTKJ_06615 [Prevotella koreensis]|uniref:hypothetical protein n=1 Tax=Prevotella koreensis TaxID=2490854 RepID=UPI003FA17EB0